MKTLEFLRETFFVLYSLYFKPSVLKKRLRAGLSSTDVNEDFTPLARIAERLNQPAARQYAFQIAVLCAAASTPVFFLPSVSRQTVQPVALVAAAVVVWIAGIGVAGWVAALGPALALSLAACVLGSRGSTQWLEVLLSQQILGQWRLVALGLLTSIGIGLLVGFGTRRLLSKIAKLSHEGLGAIAGILAGTISSVIVSAMAEDLVGGLAIVMAVVVASMIAGGIAGVIGGGVAGIVAGGIIITFIVGAGQGIWGMAAGILAVGAVVVLMAGVAGMAGGSVESIAKNGWAGALASVAAIAFGGGLGIVLATFITVISTASATALGLAAIFLGFGMGALRWNGQILAVRVSLLALLGIGFILPQTGGLAPLPGEFEKTVWWILGGIVGFVRLPLLLAYVGWSLSGYWRCRWADGNALAVLPSAPWYRDDFIPLALPYLDRLLVLAVKINRNAGLSYVEDAAATWRQGKAARSALTQVTADSLFGCNSERTIAEAAAGLVWLPEMLPPTVEATLGRFRFISQTVDDKLKIVDDETQLQMLSAAINDLSDLIKGLAFVPSDERVAFMPVADSWRSVLSKATNRLPNPFMAGDPIRPEAVGLFVGREDVMREIEARLHNRTQRPALLLFGQRRMGKSSVLYQLPGRLPKNIVPIRVDCQAPQMQEGHQAFLFNLARAIHTQAAECRGIELPAPPSEETTTYTAFSLWLEVVEKVLAQRVLLICLDEFERIGEAVSEGHLDERVLNFLRNLIQHHPQVSLLLAGSHRPEDLGQPWSSYLISVSVVEISYLPRIEARRLVEQPIPGFLLRYDAEVVEYILDITRCQPMLVQLICQELVFLLNEQGKRVATMDDIEAAIPRALERGASLYFIYLHEYDAEPQGSAILSELAKYGTGAVVDVSTLSMGQPEREVALTRLLARDLIEKVDGGVRFEIELVRRWWKEHGRPRQNAGD